MPVDLSIVVVNYNSAGYVAALLDSIFAHPVRVFDRTLELEVIIVDNASRNDDHGLLESLARDRVSIIHNTENVGYALANNQGFHVARGTWHCVSNPDVGVSPECFSELLRVLERTPGAAITGPLASMDEDGEVLLPPNELPDPYSEALLALARCHDSIARFQVRRRARYAHRYWIASEPIRLPMLSGGFFLGRRTTFERHGLFDPGYPLYYEDTDLFRRFHERDLGLWHVPSARVVHHFSRSAIPRMKASLYRNRLGAERYFRNWFGAAGLSSWRQGTARALAMGADQRCPYELVDLGPSPEPPFVEIPDVPGCYLEIAGNPKFSLTVAAFPKRPGPYRIPKRFFDALAMTHYWTRTVDPRSGDTIQAWRFTKCQRT